MKKKYAVSIAVLVSALSLAFNGIAAAHCDTLDGPVVQDARKALETEDVTPVLKWVQDKDERAVRESFEKALSVKGRKDAERAANQFFATLVKVHRAGEGAPFTGLKPAGEIDPAVAEADRALASGSADELVRLVNDRISAGIQKRFEQAAAAFQHKDESVEHGREFVKSYVEFTHYVERIHLNATGKGAHGEHGESQPVQDGAAEVHKHTH